MCNNVISNKFISNNVVSFVFLIYLCGVKNIVMGIKPFIFGVATSGENFTINSLLAKGCS